MTNEAKEVLGALHKLIDDDSAIPYEQDEVFQTLGAGLILCAEYDSDYGDVIGIAATQVYDEDEFISHFGVEYDPEAFERFINRIKDNAVIAIEENLRQERGQDEYDYWRQVNDY